MKLPKKLFIAALLLIGTAFAAAAQTIWTYGGCSLKQRGYYGTPYDGGPQYGSGGGDPDMVPPIATGNKHRPGQSHRPASGDGFGTGITGFAPASEYKTARFDLSPGPLAASGEGQKPESASGQTRG